MLKYSYILNNYIDIIWGVGGGIAPKIFIQLVMPRGPFLGCQRAVFTTVKVLPYFTDYRSMGTIGRIAAFRLNFLGNTKIGRSIP